jgi:hypothetical protein
MSRFSFATLLFVCLIALPAHAQDSSASKPAAATQAPAAKPADVASPDAILAAVYDVISGPAARAIGTASTPSSPPAPA